MRFGWLFWLLGILAGWIAYTASANLTRRFTDDWATPIVVGSLASMAAVVAVWVFKRRMPETPPRLDGSQGRGPW